MLLSHGEKSWDSLSIRERAAVAGSLGAGNCHAQQNGGNRQYRATPIRDLFTEAVHRVCSFPIYKFDELPLLRWEYEWRPTPKSEEEWQQLSLNIRQMERQLCSEAEANGYKPMLIAIDPSMASGLDLQKFILKMYKSRFGNIPRIRTRCNPLEIIEKFETDNLKRSDPYGGKTLDLRPYRELLEEYEKAYGFPKEWKTNE